MVIPLAPCQPAQPLVQPSQHRLGGKEFNAGGGQFDGQRQAIEPLAQFRHGGLIGGRELPARLRRLRPLNKQPHRWRTQFWLHGQGRHGKFIFPVQPQNFPACYQHLELGGMAQQSAHHGRGGDNLLKVIENEELVTAVQRL